MHDEVVARDAQTAFKQTFSKKEVPDDVSEVRVAAGAVLENVLLANKHIESLSAFRRLVTQGGVRNAETGEKITDSKTTISKPTTLKLGKRRFVKIIL